MRGIPTHLLSSPGGEENSEQESDSSGNNQHTPHPHPPPSADFPPPENNARYAASQSEYIIFTYKSQVSLKI